MASCENGSIRNCGYKVYPLLTDKKQEYMDQGINSLHKWSALN